MKEFIQPYKDVRSTRETDVLKVQFFSSQSRCQIHRTSTPLKRGPTVTMPEEDIHPVQVKFQ